MAGYDKNEVRIWAPSRDPRNSNNPSYARTIMILDGWGGEQATVYEASALVRARVWGKVKSVPDDSASVTIEVRRRCPLAWLRL